MTEGVPDKDALLGRGVTVGGGPDTLLDQDSLAGCSGWIGAGEDEDVVDRLLVVRVDFGTDGSAEMPDDDDDDDDAGEGDESETGGPFCCCWFAGFITTLA